MLAYSTLAAKYSATSTSKVFVCGVSVGIGPTPRFAKVACMSLNGSVGGGGVANVVRALGGVYKGLSYSKFSYKGA